MIQEAISILREGEDLSPEVMSQSFDEIMSGNATDAQIAALLMGLAIKGETPSEIYECAKIMREKCSKFDSDKKLLEIVGTGGDKVGTFNISTASAITAAAAGVPTAKHGNRSVSSKCGAADVLEALGIKIGLEKEKNVKVLEDTDICFLFAPSCHASMKYAGGVRKEIKIPTIFNILGPLVNPSMPTYQLLGVYSPELILPLAEVLKNLGVEHGLVVNGSDGIDEITLAGPTQAALIEDGEITELTINPEDYGFEIATLDDLLGGNAEENAQIIRDIFDGKKGPKRDAVELNTGAALYIAGKANSIEDGIQLARETIDSGKAKEKLEEFITASNNV